MLVCNMHIYLIYDLSYTGINFNIRFRLNSIPMYNIWTVRHSGNTAQNLTTNRTATIPYRH